MDSFYCPNCKIRMSHKKLLKNSTKNVKSNEHSTHLWTCPECPIVMLEYYEGKDIDIVARELKGVFSGEQ